LPLLVTGEQSIYPCSGSAILKQCSVVNIKSLCKQKTSSGVTVHGIVRQLKPEIIEQFKVKLLNQGK